MTDILDLPGWTPTNVRVENDEYVIEAEYTVLPDACQKCVLQPFVQIADTVGCDEKTVRTLAAEHIAHVDGGYLPALPEWLGIDETQIHGKLRLVLTDELQAQIGSGMRRACR
jgi:hypothetical protein